MKRNMDVMIRRFDGPIEFGTYMIRVLDILYRESALSNMLWLYHALLRYSLQYS